jgi:3-deoxy-D-manno-octulosonic-acid transferase
LWIHAASNGELISAKPLIEHTLKTRPDLGVLITCNTATAIDLARRWRLDRVSVQHAPFDITRVNKRMLRKWHVQAHISMESELWPDRVMCCAAADIPVAIFGARLTRRTARGWARFGGLARKVLGRISYLSAQDSRSLARLKALGLRASAVGPVLDLKASYTPPRNLDIDAAMRANFPRAQTWLAASTHPGDEEIVIEAHLAARMVRPGLRLIMAPRHPARGAEVAELLTRAGLDFAWRSRGASPNKEVLLADTMGEMPLWYSLAGTVLIGGTFSDRGGHTPYEPAAFGSALFYGRDVHNFSAAFMRLQRAHAAICVSSANELADALIRTKSPESQIKLGAAAQKALLQSGALDRVKSDLEKLIAV